MTQNISKFPHQDVQSGKVQIVIYKYFDRVCILLEFWVFRNLIGSWIHHYNYKTTHWQCLLGNCANTWKLAMSKQWQDPSICLMTKSTLVTTTTAKQSTLCRHFYLDFKALWYKYLHRVLCFAVVVVTNVDVVIKQIDGSCQCLVHVFVQFPNKHCQCVVL